MLQIVISDMTMLFEFLFIFKLLNVKLNYEYEEIMQPKPCLTLRFDFTVP